MILSFSEHCAYSFCFDNVNQKSIARHHSSQKGNTTLNMVNAFAVRNRITLPQRDENGHPCQRPSPDEIRSIPLDKILPSSDDSHYLTDEATTIVGRILKNHIKMFNNCVVDQHIPHEFSRESAEKSEVVSMVKACDIHHKFSNLTLKNTKLEYDIKQNCIVTDSLSRVPLSKCN